MCWIVPYRKLSKTQSVKPYPSPSSLIGCNSLVKMPSLLIFPWVMTLLNQVSSVAQLCPTLCNPIDCSTPFFPVHHQTPETTQTPVCHISDAIQPSNPLLSPSPLYVNLSQHQGLFQWLGYLHQVSKVLDFCFSISLPMNTQHWFPLGWTSWISLKSRAISRVFSNTTVQKHQFFGAQLSSQSNSHIHTWLLEKTIALTR